VRTDGSTSAAPPRLLLLGDTRQVHLSRWASYFAGTGWDVHTVSLETAHDFPGAFCRVPVTSALPHALRYPLAVRRIASLTRSFQPHVVNAHFAPNYGVIARAIGRHPWVLSTWGSDILTDPDKSPFHLWRTRRVVRDADWVTSDAQVMSRRLERFGVEPERILTFPFGVDTARFHPANGESSTLAIVSTRQLAPVYDVGTLIEAFASVFTQVPGATLTIVGDGPSRGQLEERARASCAAGSIHFEGMLAHRKLPVVIRRAIIYVSTARSDTTSVSLLEAMACGLFPVVPDIPANREWVADGKNGVLFEAGNPGALAGSILSAWRKPDLRRHARAVNVELIEQRASWPECMTSVHKLFDRLARSQSGATLPGGPSAE